MLPEFDPRPVTLEGVHVRLEALAPRHVRDLLEAGADPELWRYMPVPPPLGAPDVGRWVDAAVAATAAGHEVAFAIVHPTTGRAVGSTRYMDIRRADRALEIGWTWLSRSVQRTPVNTEAKLLLLAHAFEELGAVRVQLKTDGRNRVSQRAIERLGAVREGVLRRSRRCWDGVWRDTVYFSVLDSEWPAVRRRLLALLEASGSR